MPDAADALRTRRVLVFLAVAGVAVLFARGQPNPLLGPAPTGVVPSLPWAALALLLLWRDGALAPPDADAP